MSVFCTLEPMVMFYLATIVSKEAKQHSYQFAPLEKLSGVSYYMLVVGLCHVHILIVLY